MVKKEQMILVLIFLIALSMHIMALVHLPIQYGVLKVDAQQYDDLAVNLLSGKGYFTQGTGFLTRSWKPPVYPLFLAGIYSVFGHHYLAVRIIQSIIGALLCVLIFFIGKTIFNRKVGLLSAFILAFYPPYTFNYLCGPTTLFSETFVTFLLALTVLLVAKGLLLEFSPMDYLLTGILMGLLALTRSFFALFPFILLALVFYKNKYALIFTVKKMLPLLIGFILVILPWIVRNYFVYKAFVPFTTQGGYVLLGGNNPYANGGGLTSFDKLFTPEEADKLSKMSEVEKDNFCREYAKTYMLQNYKKLPKLFFKKLLVQWDVFDTIYDSGGRIIGRKYNIWYGIILMLCLFGIAMAIRSKMNMVSFLIILLFAYFSIMAIIFHGDPRFRYPAEAFMIIFASFGVFSIRNAIRNKMLAYATIGVIIAINLLFYFYSDLILSWVRRII